MLYCSGAHAITLPWLPVLCHRLTSAVAAYWDEDGMPELLPAAAEVLWQGFQTDTTSTLQDTSMAATLISCFHALLCHSCPCQILPSFYMPSQQCCTKPQSIQHNECMPADKVNISTNNNSCLREAKVDAACVQASLLCLQRLLQRNGSRRSPCVRLRITASLLVAQQSANCS